MHKDQYGKTRNGLMGSPHELQNNICPNHQLADQPNESGPFKTMNLDGLGDSKISENLTLPLNLECLGGW